MNPKALAAAAVAFALPSPTLAGDCTNGYIIGNYFDPNNPDTCSFSDSWDWWIAIPTISGALPAAFGGRAPYSQTTISITNTDSISSFDYAIQLCVAGTSNCNPITCENGSDSGKLTHGASASCSFNPVSITFVPSLPEEDVYVLAVNLSNNNLLFHASASISVSMTCPNNGYRLDSTLCTPNNEVGAYLDPNAPGQVGLVTGGCVATGCGGSDYCCPSGQAPSSSPPACMGNVAPSPCWNCTGLC